MSIEVSQKPENRTTHVTQQFHFWLYISERKWKLVTWKDTRTSVFIAALFTTAKVHKQPKRPSRVNA